MEITADILALVRRFMSEEIPFNRLLGIEVDHIERGLVRLAIPYRPELIGDPFRPALHGGVIATLIDTVGGAAVWSTVNISDRVSTIDMRVDYLRPGRALRLLAEARVIRAGNRVGVTAVRAFHPDAPDEAVAEGRGVYNIKRGHSGIP